MKIINKKVEHKSFGAGTIYAMNSGKVYIEFGKIFGMKSFPYPEIFAEGKMKLMDEEAQEELMEDIVSFPIANS